MRRFAILFLCCALLAGPAAATSEFNKQWKSRYLSEDNKELTDDFKKKVRSAGCYVCHVKKHPDKKKARNEYGKAIHKFLKEDDFPKDWVKANPEEAKQKIREGFKKAGELKNKAGESFTARIKKGLLPTDDYEFTE